MSELRSLAERNNGNLTDVEKVEEDLRAVNGRIEEIAEGNQDRGELSSMKKTNTHWYLRTIAWLL